MVTVTGVLSVLGFYMTATILLYPPPARTRTTRRYSIPDRDSSIGINPSTGQLYSLRPLDRELEATHVFHVKAQEEPNGASFFISPVFFKQ